MTLAVAVCAVLHENKILLLNRSRGDYVGLLALPGGKIEEDEHVSSASIREVKEETGIDAEFVEHLGVVSEILREGQEKKHLLLNICLLRPISTILTEINGSPDWYSLDNIMKVSRRLIPSDLRIIEEMVKGKKYYVECIMEKYGNKHELIKFE